MTEPSVLDYVIAKLTFWRKTTLTIPPLPDEETVTEVAGDSDPIISSSTLEEAVEKEEQDQPPGGGEENTFWGSLPLLVPLGLALIGQLALEPPRRSLKIGIAFYAFAIGSLLWLMLRGKWQIASIPTLARSGEGDFSLYRRSWLVAGTLLALLSFIFFGGNRFNGLNLLFWLLSLGSYLCAFWIRAGERKTLRQRWTGFIEGGINFSPWTLLVIAVFGVVAFFRFYQLNEVPPEMFSDHAEKLLDVADVLDGKYSIYFTRNTGREAIQMYLTAAVAKLFGTGLSFLSLKLGTVSAGLLTLPYIYLLGKEIGNRRVGLLAMFLAGVAYWPNVISRVALRFTLYPLFVAPLLYYLIRGLRHRRRNDFLYAGIALGLGLHGYSSFRVVPLTVIVIFVVYFFHQRSAKERVNALVAFGLVVLLSLIVFLPLLRFAMTNYDIFMYRALTRMAETERALPGSPVKIFFQNLWDAMTMFQWDNGATWVHSVPGRPALGVVSAALFSLGMVTLVVRYVRERHWLDLFLLLSVPLLLLASVLALAFPAENPCLNRTGGAIIPVFLIAGMGLEALGRGLAGRAPSRWRSWAGWGLVGLFMVVSAGQNYDLVFNDYYEQFDRSSWNTSELGTVIRQFADTVGDPEHAWVVPYPHWVDTRLVGIRAGYPRKDYALWGPDLPSTLEVEGPKLFLFKPNDVETEKILRDLYPNGTLDLYEAKYAGQNFMVFFVP